MNRGTFSVSFGSIKIQRKSFELIQTFLNVDIKNKLLESIQPNQRKFVDLENFDYSFRSNGNDLMLICGVLLIEVDKKKLKNEIMNMIRIEEIMFQFGSFEIEYINVGNNRLLGSLFSSLDFKVQIDDVENVKNQPKKSHDVIHNPFHCYSMKNNVKKDNNSSLLSTYEGFLEFFT